ncbi:MAG TPA: GNAT family N-acetyltransferase [Lentisphaeria bacterium]|nr:MAG: hypothetical protein A2X47_13105 [Lentisphaerae bacterium GWF2_38_69]HBM16010.1 GNAT family N-acetyltransferase [Lentisphaeria bacterium]
MIPSSYKIRHARPEDISSIINFNKAMALETEHKILDNATLPSGVQAVIDGKAESFYLVAVDYENKAIACLLITKEWSDWRNAFICWIKSVYVLPQFRRQGIFTDLYKYLKELSKEQNCCGLRLYVERNNHKAQTTYLSLGMTKSHYIIFEDMPDEK